MRFLLKLRRTWRIWRARDWRRWWGAMRHLLRDPETAVWLWYEVQRWKNAAEELYVEERDRLQKRGEGARCGHPRQLTADGHLLPCAWPECHDGVKARAWRRALLAPPSVMWRISDPEILPASVETYGRKEAWTTDDRMEQVERHFFWVLESKR